MDHETSGAEDSAGQVSGGFRIAIGPYRVIRELGRGGQGVVYLAEHESEGKMVALKVLDGVSSQNAATMGRFRREALAASAIQHPGICGIVETGIDSSTPYIAMEYVEGQTLAERIAMKRTNASPSAFNVDFGDGATGSEPSTPTSSLDHLTILETVAIVEKAARALHAAHEKGVIHRDLKPANIMISTSGEPVILDFGLAHHDDPGIETLTRTGDLIGTPAYMSPEQLSRQLIRLDRRTDVWSLGVCLFEAITLQRPFEAPTRERLYQAILTKEPAPASSVNQHVSADLDVVLQTALDKDRDRRYKTALDFAEDLRNVRARAPILAQAPTAWTKISRWARRNPAVASLIAGVFLALAAGLVVALVLLAKVATEKERADESAKSEGAAKVVAEKKRVEAESSLTYARSANEALSSVFLDLDPERTYRTVGDMRDALRDNLGKALEKLDTIAVGDPLQVATMQVTLATSILRLGDRVAAVPVLERALAATEAAAGPDHRSTLWAMTMVASAYRYAGKIEQGLALQRKAQDRLRATLGPDDPLTLSSLGNLGLALTDSGRHGEALECFEEASRRLRDLRGANDHDVMHWTIGLALVCQKLGQRARALTLLEQLLPGFEATLGRDHPETLQCLMAIGSVKGEMGRPDPHLLEDALERARGRVGLDHPTALVTANNLGLAYSSMGDHVRAVQVFEETLPRMRAVHGADHPYTLSCMMNLGLEYSSNGQRDKAIPLLEEVLQIQKSTRGPGHEAALTAANALGEAHQAAGQPDEAIAVFEEALANARTPLGDDHDGVILVMHNLAAALDGQNQTDRAIELRLQAARGVARGGFRHVNAETIFDIGVRVLEYFKRFADASELRRERVKFVEKRSGPDSLEYAQELGRLAVDLLSQEQWEEAERMLRPSVAIREKAEPGGWLTCNAKSLLGRALLEQRKFQDAEPLLLAALQGMQSLVTSTTEPDHLQRLAAAMARVIRLYEATGRKEEAQHWTTSRKALTASRPETRSAK